MYTIGNYMAQLMYGMCRTCTIDCSTGKQTARSRSLRASRQTHYQINTLPYGGRLEARNRAPHICQRGHHARCKDGLPHVTESASIAAITGLTSLPAEPQQQHGQCVSGHHAYHMRRLLWPAAIRLGKGIRYRGLAQQSSSRAAYSSGARSMCPARRYSRRSAGHKLLRQGLACARSRPRRHQRLGT